MVYIQGIGEVSIQQEGSWCLPNFEQATFHRVAEPPFANYIPPLQARRMSTIVKRALVSAKKCLDNAQTKEELEGIISSTGLGCVEDTEKFLVAMLKEEERFLQPTHFIQSTHNTIGAQIAIQLQCNAYNTTYSHRGISFESALLDAFVSLQSQQLNNVLLGGYDEMTPNYHLMFSKLDFWEKNTLTLADFVDAKSPGSFAGEGCVSFYLSTRKQENSYACIEAVDLFHQETLSPAQIEAFLHHAHCRPKEIDALMLSNNGDLAHDGVCNAFYDAFLPNTPQLLYVPFSGYYYTASAMGLAALARLMKSPDEAPRLFRKNPSPKAFHRVLFHHHSENNHALTLIRSC